MLRLQLKLLNKESIAISNYNENLEGLLANEDQQRGVSKNQAMEVVRSCLKNAIRQKSEDCTDVGT